MRRQPPDVEGCLARQVLRIVSKGRKSDGRAADFARLGMVLQRVLQPILRQFLHLPRNWVLRPAQTGG
jgi:Cft2 family RNA processing exonuclease